MSFINRLGYYLGGFAIGLIVLAFFLNGKDASCDYGPNARTVKNISSKPIIYGDKAQITIAAKALDSIIIKQLISYGDVDFNKSVINEDSCNTYIIENSYKNQEVTLTVLNCEEQAILTELVFGEL